MKFKDRVLNMLIGIEEKTKQGVTASEISKLMKVDRANVSRALNQLCEENSVEKIVGRPVIFKSVYNETKKHIEDKKYNTYTIDRMIGAKDSLKLPIQQAKAAILYPPRGLHSLLLGETGVGKSMFAELMYKYAVESRVIEKDSPFVQFNCADYAENPQLLMGHIFGVKKGAYTGADRDRNGLLKKAHGGIIFLDEVHRLSPQGQEMLFTFIDKGEFRPLGESERISTASVQIIAATTEDPESFLLQTFIRRIPVSITLPSLSERGLKEKCALIDVFTREESKRVGKSIYMNKNVLINLLLYESISNIGQLKSDIQLCCAKGFLNYKSKRNDYILINQEDLPNHIKKGGLNINHKRKEIDSILKNSGEVIRFHYKDPSYEENIIKRENENEDFYDGIEKRIQALKKKGLEDTEIEKILDTEIHNHFEEYLKIVHSKIKRHELAKVVGEDIVECAENILNYACKRLNRSYDESLYCALALHLNGSLKRIKEGQKIYNPKLNFIRINHGEEFFVAIEVAREIDKKFNIETPLDEIGYLALFLISNNYEFKDVEKNRVRIVLILHGNSTATSMAEVANTLVGDNNVIPLDMPLSMNVEDMYNLAKETIRKTSQGKGILLLVDMGSLVNFGDMIYEETGIIIKTIDMVSTPIVMEACRGVALGKELQEIYDSCKDVNGIKQLEEVNRDIKKNLILTACFTGEGAADRLKRILEEKLNNIEEIEIVPMNILNRREFLTAIDYYREKNKILAIVGTVPVEAYDIPFISAMEILSGHGIERLKKIFQGECIYKNMSNALREHLSIEDTGQLINNIRITIEEIRRNLNISLSDDVEIGIILHMCFMIDTIKLGKRKEKHCEGMEEYENQYSRETSLVKDCIKRVEKIYEIDMLHYEKVYLTKMILCNSENEITQK